MSDYNVTFISDNELYDLDVDIFCPCAIGSIINDSTINRLKCKIIAGAANNILQDYKKHGQQLFDKNILYAPDYVINAGGLINIYNELQPNYNRDSIFQQVDSIYETLTDIFKMSIQKREATNIISDKLAVQIIENKKKLVGAIEYFE